MATVLLLSPPLYYRDGARWLASHLIGGSMLETTKEEGQPIRRPDSRRRQIACRLPILSSDPLGLTFYSMEYSIAPQCDTTVVEEHSREVGVAREVNLDVPGGPRLCRRIE